MCSLAQRHLAACRLVSDNEDTLLGQSNLSPGKLLLQQLEYVS